MMELIKLQFAAQIAICSATKALYKLDNISEQLESYVRGAKLGRQVQRRSRHAMDQVF